jgi:sugar lactone lactonase YvrE
MRRLIVVFSVLTILAGVGLPAVYANGSNLIVALDGNAEGLAISKTGTFYLSFPFTGEVRAISPDGSQRTVATLPTGGGFGPTGIAIDAPGNVYVCDVTTDPATQGVYRIARDGSVERLAGTGAIPFANGLAFDQRGNIYVGDSITGAVWRIPRGGSAELWAQDSLLEGDGSAGFGFPIGANGVAVRHNTVLVTVSEGARVVEIPILANGSAGTPKVFAEGPELYGSDGIALDVHGNVWVPVIVQSTIVRISADGSSLDTVLTSDDGLDFASSDAFGTGRGNRKTLYAVNFAIGPPGGTGPALLAFDLGVPGDPLP